VAVSGLLDFIAIEATKRDGKRVYVVCILLVRMVLTSSTPSLPEEKVVSLSSRDVLHTKQ